MTTTTGTGGDSVLRRMLGEDARPLPPLTVHRALRLALGQLANEHFDIDIEICGIEDNTLSQSALGNLRLSHGIHFLTEGPGGAIGVAAASRDLIAALIEVQTTGRITSVPGPDRTPTPTDAAMVDGFLDAVLSRLGAVLGAVEGEEWIRGHRLGRAIFDLHQIALELHDITYRMLRAAVSFAPDGKQGEIVLALPADPLHTVGADLGAQVADAARSWSRRLGSTVGASAVTLRAVLHRMNLPVSQLRALGPGDLLTVPGRKVHEIALEGSDGRIVAVGRLGMADSMKAVRIAAIGARSTELPTVREPGTAPPRLDLDDLGLGELHDGDPPLDINASAISAPIITPDDLPDLGDVPPLPPLDGLSQDGTIPLNDLPELVDDPPLGIATVVMADPD